MCVDEIDQNGNAELTFTHASEYTIIIDEKPATTSPKTGDTSSAANILEAKDTMNVSWRNWWIVLIGAVILIIGLEALVVMKKKKEDL